MKTEFSERLKKYRENAGVTPKALADAIGVGVVDIEEWERGDCEPDKNRVDSLCAFYSVTPEQLMWLDPDEITDISAAKAEEPPAVPDVERASGEGFIKRDRVSKYYRAIPVFLAALALFLFLGLTFGVWHPAWLLFLCVPVVYSVFQAFAARTVRKFNYPLFIAALFLFLGFVFDVWQIAWIILLTIPIFYLIF